MLHRLMLILFLPLICLAQYQRPGSTDGQFLKIGVSPRATAMGDAYIAIANGAEGMYYNVSSLAWIKGTDIVFNHNMWFAGINHEFFGAAHTIDEDIGTFGVSVIALYTDEMLVRTPLQPDGTGETFYAGNYRIGLSYSRFFTDRVTVGASINYLNFSLYKDFSADAVSVDISAMYNSDFRGFKFGMQISHFGSNIKFVNEAYPLPTNFTFGAGINAIDGENQKLLVSFSATKPNDGQPLTQFGAEWNFMNILFARGGYRFNHDIATYSLGAGVKWDFNLIGLRFDYSYCKYSILGSAHQFGLGVSF